MSNTLFYTNDIMHEDIEKRDKKKNLNTLLYNRFKFKL